MDKHYKRGDTCKHTHYSNTQKHFPRISASLNKAGAETTVRAMWAKWPGDWLDSF